MKSLHRCLTLGALALSAATGKAAPPAKANATTAISVATVSVVPVFAELLLAAQNMCLDYSYDLNGNRLSQTVSAAGTSQTWGSTTYPCFEWTAP